MLQGRLGPLPDSDLIRAQTFQPDGANQWISIAKSLQNHAKPTIAPFKYQRSVVLSESQKTTTGRIQRFKQQSSTELSQLERQENGGS